MTRHHLAVFHLNPGYLALAVGLLLAGGTVIGIVLFRNTDDSPGPDPIDEGIELIDPYMEDAGHDHANASQHNFSSPNLHLIDYNYLELDDEGRPREGNAEVTIWNDELAFIAGYRRFFIVDITDPANTVTLAAHETQDAITIDVKVSNDGQYAFLNSQYVDPQIDPSPNNAPESPGINGVLVMDVSDPSNPVQVNEVVELDGSGNHNMWYQEIQGREFLFIADLDSSPTTGGIIIHEIIRSNFVNEQPWLPKIGDIFVDPGQTNGGGIFVHDMVVDVHPITEQVLVYGSWWDGGMWIHDVSDPPAYSPTVDWDPPVTGIWLEDLPVDTDGNIHYARPHKGLIDGRHITVTGPEYGSKSVGTGNYTVLDTTDPTNITQYGRWTLPDFDNNNSIPSDFRYSPHNLDAQNGLVCSGNYHAGVWIFDISNPDEWMNPTTLGYYLPHGDDSQQFESWIFSGFNHVPFNWGCEIDDRGYLYTTDLSTGLYVLQMDGMEERMAMFE